MAHHDLTRLLFQPDNHYTGVRFQQGRPLLDSDFDEGELLGDEDRRAQLVDLIGPHGSPDAGFSITNVGTILFNFDIVDGTYYLGGLRHQLSGTSAPGTPQRYREQSDWLQAGWHGALPQCPKNPTEVRDDLVYLVGWEQSISAVEDPEFLEHALGGPDSAARLRRMHRVYVRKDSKGNCTAAFSALVADLTAGGHRFDAEHHELCSAARLTVLISDPPKDDPCKPRLAPGYTGPENQAIRVQLITPTRLLWSMDNAAPLYRARLSLDPSGSTLTFLTPPRDAAHYPELGEVLEILPWGAELPNGSHVADHRIAADIGAGVLARVRKAYDPSTGKVTFLPESQAALDKLELWFDEHSISSKGRYVYVRVWKPGDNAGDGFGLAFKPGVSLPLAGTGLEITISQAGIVGDYWIIAARPSEPERVVPWTLLQRAPPQGPRRYYCPLAVIHWWYNIEPGFLEATVESCRRPFRPLTRQGGCCTVTVGDGVTSFGDFTTITAAIAAIPAHTAGRICILPGVYEERLVLKERSNLTLEGCGTRTILRTPPGNTTSQGLITIAKGTSIILRDFHLEARGQFGVMIYQDSGAAAAFSRRITLDRLTISTQGDTAVGPPAPNALWIPTTSAPFPLSTIAADSVDELRIVGCTLTMDGLLSAAANVILLRCTRSLVRDCQIRSAGPAWGGLHLGQACQALTIERNTIQGGQGHGISLGSLYSQLLGPFDFAYTFDPSARFVLVASPVGFESGGGIPATAPAPGGGNPVPVLIGEALRDVQILHNTITGMVGSGISVFGFRPDPEGPALVYEMIQTFDFVIADNLIEGNYVPRLVDPLPAEIARVTAFGGVVLADADALHVRDNVIRNQGTTHARPVCGVYVMHGESLVVEDNQIRDNGPRGAGMVVPGHRAGIALQLVGRRVISDGDGGLLAEQDTLLPAVRVRGNVVDQPAGRALQIYGFGPMFIEGNVLTSEGLGLPSIGTVTHCVEIHNFGQSPELIAQGWIPADVAMFPAPPMLYDPASADPLLADGRILFTDNQVRFDPVLGEFANVVFATRIASYGDVAVQDNQFFVRFRAAGGHLVFDTAVLGWSTRTSNNRWEDPAEGGPNNYETDASAQTLAVMNITAHNQGTRCIYVNISGNAPPILDKNPIESNQTFTPCSGTGTLLVNLLK